MTNRSDRIKAHLNAKKLNEDAAGDVLRATVAKHKLKRMEGTKKSPALIAKLTARVAAGKRYQTEEAIKKAVKPALKPVKPLTNNPGYGYHGIVDRKHKGDANKAHAAYNAMHAKVKNWAGEAGHLAVSKKPDLMVRDYLDSKRGRHLEGLEADEKYIKKDFGHFSRSYDPKLFVESVDLNEGDLKFTEHPDPSKDSFGPGKHAADAGMTIIRAHHKGKHVATIHATNRMPEHASYHVYSPDEQKMHPAFTQELEDKYKDKTLFGKVKPGQEHLRRSVDYPTKRSALRAIKQHYAGGKVNEELNEQAGEHHFQSKDDLAKHLSALHEAKFEETLNETTRSEDAQRVQYGVMKREDYLKKWKIGKYGPNKNKLAGPGGLYKNLLVGSSIDNKSAATKK